MTTWKNDFEEGAAAGGNGITLTAANSAGTGETAFTAVSAVADNTIVFSTAQAAHGSYSLRFTDAASNTPSYGYVNTGSSPVQLWFRVYLYMAAWPTRTLVFFTSAASPRLGVGLSVDGYLYMMDDYGTTATGVLAASKNQWIRIEGFLSTGAGTGQMEAKLFNTKDSVTPDATLTSPPTWSVPAGNTQYPAIGVGLVTTTWTVYCDDFAYSDTGYIGPAIVTTPVAVTGIGAAAASGVPAGIPGLYTPTAYAASYTTGGGTGSWVNPGNATGAPDGTTATWTAL